MPETTTDTTTNDDVKPVTTADDTKTAAVDAPKAKASDSAGEAGTFSADYVKDLRKESANYRNQAKELQRKSEEAEAKAAEAAELKNTFKASQEEAQRALNESKRLNSAFEQRVINAELKAAAMEAGMIDLDAFKMADTSKIKITEKGDVVGIKELISDLKKEKAYLFKEITTSNKNASAPESDAKANEKPVYQTPQEFKEAKRKLLASFT